MDEEAHLRAIFHEGAALRVNGRTLEGEERYRRCWAEARRRSLPTVAVDVGFSFALGLLEAGRLDEAEAVVGEATEIVRRIGEAGRLTARSRAVPAELAFIRGRRSEAVEWLAREARDVTDPHAAIPYPEVLALWLALLDGRAAAEQRLENRAQHRR